nr:AMP-binding protein [Virgisporangium aliadipatigenens]
MSMFAAVEAPISIAGRTRLSGDLHTAAARLATRLGGARAVAVHATPSLETVVGVLAGLHAGVPVVPVPPDSGPLEREHILRDSGAEIVLSEETVDLDATGPEAPAVQRDPALILYTSGTTGPPKGVALSRAAIAAGLDGLAEAWQWNADDTLVHGLPLYHVHGLGLGVLGALRTGCRLVHTGRPVPAAYAAAGGSLYFGVPTIWSRIAADPGVSRALRPARLLVSGSAALPTPVFAALRARSGHAPVERYGMTETMITVSARADGPRRPGHVGTPIRGVETRRSPEGELEIRGATLFSGYVGRPEETANAHTPDGWFRTGDAAEIDADGWHRILGRIRTDLIKSGGFRIGAGEVEDALLTHPAVREAAVVGAPHADLGEQVVAYVVADGVAERALIEHVATSLSVHKRPRRVVFVESLPRNGMGKLQKHLLQK